MCVGGVCVVCVICAQDMVRSLFLIIAHLSSKTPGGRLVYLYVKKRGTAPKCGDCGSKMNGVSVLMVLAVWCH